MARVQVFSGPLDQLDPFTEFVLPLAGSVYFVTEAGQVVDVLIYDGAEWASAGLITAATLPELTSPVQSVNGQTGAVVLTAAHVGAPTVADLTAEAAARTAGDALALAKASNLADLANAGTARSNLGLGDSATRNVGTTAATVAAGNDSRFTDARTPTAHAATHTAGGSDAVALNANQITAGTLDDARIPASIARVGGASLDPLREKRHMQFVKNPGAATGTAVGFAAAPTFAAGTGQTITSDDDADGPFLRGATSGVLNNTWGLESAFTVVRRDWLPEFHARVKTHTDIAALRIWVGLASATLGTVGAPTTQHVMAFRYDTVLDTTAFWRAVTNGGVTPTVTATTSAVAVSTAYDLTVRCPDTSTVKFYVNGVEVASHTTQLPAAATLLGYFVRVATLAAASKAVKWSRLALLHR